MSYIYYVVYFLNPERGEGIHASADRNATRLVQQDWKNTTVTLKSKVSSEQGIENLYKAVEKKTGDIKSEITITNFTLLREEE